jgi:hypothetical protein
MAKHWIKYFSLAVVVIFFSVSPSFGQNTKGDKPSENRESRFSKSGKNQKLKAKRRAGKEKAGKPVGRLRSRRVDARPSGEKNRNVFSQKGRYVNGSNPPADDRRPVSNRRVRARDSSRSSRAGRSKNVYSQKGRYVNNPSANPSGDNPRPVSNRKIISRVQTRSARSRPNNVFPQEGRYVNNPSKVPRSHPRSVSNKPTLTRLKKLQGTDPRPGKKTRVITRSNSRSYTSRRSINVQASYPRPKRKTERATTRDISGRRLRTRNYETPPRDVIRSEGGTKKFSTSGKNRTSQADRDRYGRFTNFSSRRDGGPKKRKIVPRSVSATARKIHPQRGRYVNNPSTQPRAVEQAQPDGYIKKRLRALQTKPPRQGGRKMVVVPRSASGSFTARRSTNVWAHYPRPKKKGEKAFTRDLAGRRLRTKNYETPPRAVITPTFKPYYGKKRVGDKPYDGRAGGYSSATRSSHRAWKGDIAGRKIRGIKIPKSDTPGKITGGYRTATGKGDKRWSKSPLPVKPPGLGAAGMSTYRGFNRKRAGLRNQGEEYAGNIKRKGLPRSARAVNGYPGKMKMFSGQPGFQDQGEEFTGFIRAKRPVKGGGSISGKSWNNDGKAVSVRTPASGYDRIGKFQGTLKARKPLKGGGSVSGELWNNDERPVPVRNPAPGYDRIGKFQGHVKASKPVKGGGSISGKLWNNDETPISVRTPAPGADRVGYSGKIRLSRFKKAYVKNPNAADEALAKQRPSKSVFQEGNLQIRVARRAYVRNSNAAEGSLKKLKPTQATYNEDKLQTKVKQYNYVRNQSSSTSALRVREPGRAFARASDYQGNVKMQKFTLFQKNRDLHPDARFVKTNRNNVSGEKDPLTNFKLWWARLFRKGETQPDHLKEKGKRPRYDKGEDGLWYE